MPFDGVPSLSDILQIDEYVYDDSRQLSRAELWTGHKASQKGRVFRGIEGMVSINGIACGDCGAGIEAAGPLWVAPAHSIPRGRCFATSLVRIPSSMHHEDVRR